MKSLIGYLFVCFFSAGLYSQPGPVVNYSGNDTMQVNEWLKPYSAHAKKKTEEAIQDAQKALDLSERTGYRRGSILSYTALGNLLMSKREYTPALNKFENAKALLKESGDDAELGRILKSMGDLYSATSYFRQSFDHYREAANLLRKTGQLKLLNECQDALGNIALEFGQSRGSINWYNRSLIIKNSLNDAPGVLTTTAKISKIYLSLKQYDSALYFNREVQRLAKDDREKLADAAIDELVILSFQGKMQEAAEAKKNAEQMVSLQNNPSNRIKLLAATSNYYLALKDKDMYSKYFDSASTMISNAKSVELAVTGLSMLAEMSSQNDDYKTAFRMLKLMDRYKDVFRNENMERVSAEIKNTAEASLNEKEIAYLGLLNKLKEEELSKEELKRMALLRENILKDSSIANQQLLMDAVETESELRSNQLKKEKELSLSLSRENELKQQLLNDERSNKRFLWTGMAALALLVGIIFFQYRKQRSKNKLINKQSAELQVLNKEIHHRVKNNLQVISSMLDLQSQTLNDPNATAIIREGIQRVQSMAFIHQNLYQGNAVNAVNMDEYIRMLSNHLFQTYNIRTDKIRLHTQIADLKLHTDTAIPLGMILNELISNALKYAFRNREHGDIWVTMKKQGAELMLSVKDNGTGLPEGFDPGKVSSFGYEIIKAFAQKLKARMNISNSNGTDVQLFITKFKTTE